jgi:hypothetical protein
LQQIPAAQLEADCAENCAAGILICWVEGVIMNPRTGLAITVGAVFALVSALVSAQSTSQPAPKPSADSTSNQATNHANKPTDKPAKKPKQKIDPGQQHPDVTDVKVRRARDGKLFDFDVTLSSPYDTRERYADAFRVSNGKGLTFGERELLHDHQNEQPFTRDLYDVDIPQSVKEVVVQGRDRKFGYGGKTMTVKLPGR